MHRRTTIAYRMAEAFFRNYRLFLIAFLIVSAVTMGTLYLRSKTYEANALTQIVTEDVAAALGEPENTGWVSPAQKNVSQLDVLLNGSFLGAALSNAKLQRPINTDPRADDPRLALLRKKLTTSVQSETLFAISLTWDNPSEAEEIVRAVQQQYITEIGQERFAQSYATLEFLDNQIKEYAGRLRNVELLLTRYKKANPGQLPDAQNADISQLASLTAQLDNLRITAQDAAKRKSALAQRITQIKPLSVAEQMATESPLQREINALKARRDALMVDRTPEHPDILNLNEKIAALEQQQQNLIKAGAPEAQQVLQTKLQDNPEWQSLHQQLVDANIEQQSQAAQVQNLQSEIARYNTRVNLIPDEQRTLTDKTRDYKVVQAEYDSLLQRRQQVEMEGNLARVSASSSLSPIGYIHAEPTTGRTKLIAMFAGSLFLGLIVGLGLVVLCEWADNSLRYSSDAERLLGMPVLAVVREAASLQTVSVRDDRRRGIKKVLGAPKVNAKPRAALESPVAAPAMSASAVEGIQ